MLLDVADDHARQKYGIEKKNFEKLGCPNFCMEILSDVNNGIVYQIVQRY